MIDWSTCSSASATDALRTGWLLLSNKGSIIALDMKRKRL